VGGKNIKGGGRGKASLISPTALDILKIREGIYLKVVDMRRILWLATCLALIIIVLGLTGCEGFTSPTPRTTSTGGLTTQNTGIWVTGTGEVSVIPDVAILRVGVEAQEATVMEAMASASEAMGQVGLAITNSGIESKDIQTQYFNIRQRTRWDDITDEEIVTGYRVTNKMTVKIRSLPLESYTLDYKASKIIESVVEAGGDLIRIDDLSFSVEDPTIYYDEAREKATADAKAKAEKLAEQTGVRLGEPTCISESAYMPTIYGGLVYGMAEAPIPAPAPVVEPPLSPGEVQVTLTVQIAYSIR
jgi:uncharacterized protein YggE